MSETMQIWDALRTPPKDALKTIAGGRLKGMTDISPQWRYRAMTEKFGPIGIGWKYEIETLWDKELSTGEVLCFANINLYFAIEGKWSDPIPGVGGSKLLAKESSGLFASDEGYKMAITDALSVAMKQLGVAADVYSGKWDGTKYKDEPTPAKEEPKQESAFHAHPGLVTELYDIAKERGAAFEDVLSVAKKYSPDNVKDGKILFSQMGKEEYLSIREAFEKDIWKEVARPEPKKDTGLFF